MTDPVGLRPSPGTPSCATCRDRGHLVQEADNEWRCVDISACIARRMSLLNGSVAGDAR
jgi:hypothetical protein